MFELTFLVISIDVKEKKYFSKIENFIKFYIGAYILVILWITKDTLGQKLKIGALIFNNLRFLRNLRHLEILSIWECKASKVFKAKDI